MGGLPVFAERLQALMRLKNIKSKQLGTEIGVSGSLVRYWQRGEKQAGLPNLIKLANYFNCTIDFLAGRSDDEIDFVPQTPPPFHKALRRILAIGGVSKYKFTWHTKFGDNYFYSWDHGAQPNLSTLIALADIFGCSIDYLVGYDN